MPHSENIREDDELNAETEYLDNGPLKIIVSVEYDRHVGRQMFTRLRLALLSNLNDDSRRVLITSMAGRYRSFEIRVQHKIIYSRLATGGYPAPRNLVHAVKSALKGDIFFTCEAPPPAFAMLKFG